MCGAGLAKGIATTISKQSRKAQRVGQREANLRIAGVARLGRLAHERILSKGGIYPVKQINISHINRVFR